MEIIAYSNWLGNLLRDSFLRKYKVHVTPSGINLDLFKPIESNLKDRFKIGEKKIILGCANNWSSRKGYQDFIALSKLLEDEYQIVMIGLTANEIKALPNNVIGLQRTESIEELAQWYSLSYVFVNPTSQDNFPTTNLEALACGTPVITYKTGGSPEALDEDTGFVVNKGDVKGIIECIFNLNRLNYDNISKACRVRAERFYDKKTRYLEYLNVFEGMLKS
jgi:glycosyltransferase involved in cell wall biosynthesis